MVNLEKKINLQEQEDNLENNSEQELNPNSLKDNYSKTLEEIKNDSELLNNSLDDNHDLSPEELKVGQNELTSISQEENNLINDWRKVSTEIIKGNEEAYNESWTQAASERFGINDFNVENFLRPNFNLEAYNQAYQEDIIAGGDGQKIINQASEFIEGETYNMAVKSFEAMQLLEDEKPGSVKLLHEKFGITNFQRYPAEILLQQLNETDPQKENAFLAFSVDDHNGAFDNQLAMWKKIYKQQQAEFNFRIAECSNTEDLINQLAIFQQESEKQIDLMFLSAHGNPDMVQLGPDGYNDVVTREDLSEIKNIFTDKAQIIANACSAGAINGWIQKISKE
ncbi:MAG: hypothetical protein WAW11_05495, partial [Patescibacteria group bacterium]